MTKTKQQNNNKEWRGNGATVNAMIGLSTVWNPGQRAAGDFYTTDPEAVKKLVEEFSPAWGAHKDFKFWEPACGTGNISKVLEEYGNGHEVISTDLYDRGYGTSGVDFLQAPLPDGVRVIITNPPYSLADEFVKHAMEILPWNGIYIALNNLSYLAGKKRYSEIYEKGFLKRIYINSGRINCYKNDINTGRRSPVNYAWFMYQNNHTEYCNEAGFDWEAWEKEVLEDKNHIYTHMCPHKLKFGEPIIYWL